MTRLLRVTLVLLVATVAAAPAWVSAEDRPGATTSPDVAAEIEAVRVRLGTTRTNRRYVEDLSILARLGEPAQEVVLRSLIDEEGIFNSAAVEAVAQEWKRQGLMAHPAARQRLLDAAPAILRRAQVTSTVLLAILAPEPQLVEVTLPFCFRHPTNGPALALMKVIDPDGSARLQEAVRRARAGEIDGAMNVLRDLGPRGHEQILKLSEEPNGKLRSGSMWALRAVSTQFNAQYAARARQLIVDPSQGLEPGQRLDDRSSDEVRGAAIELLRAMGDQGVDVIASILEGPDTLPAAVRLRCVDSLAGPYGSGLHRYCEAGRWDIAAKFIRALQWAKGNKSLADVLEKTDDKDPDVAKAMLPIVLQCISRLSLTPSDAELIKPLLSNPDKAVRMQVMKAVLQSSHNLESQMAVDALLHPLLLAARGEEFRELLKIMNPGTATRILHDDLRQFADTRPEELRVLLEWDRRLGPLFGDVNAWQRPGYRLACLRYVDLPSVEVSNDLAMQRLVDDLGSEDRDVRVAAARLIAAGAKGGRVGPVTQRRIAAAIDGVQTGDALPAATASPTTSPAANPVTVPSPIWSPDLSAYAAWTATVLCLFPVGLLLAAKTPRRRLSQE